MSWLRARWKLVLALAGTFLAGLLIGTAGGSADQEASAASVTVRETATVAGESATTTVVEEPETVTETVTETETVRVKAKAPQPKSFTGNGGKTLRVTLARDSTLHWKNDGGLFQLWDEDFGVSVNSQGRKGTTFVPAGSYVFTVNALGNWTMSFR